MNTYCEQCGAPLPSNAALQFCTECGRSPSAATETIRRLSKPLDPKDGPEKPKRLPVPARVAALAAVVALGAGATFLALSSNGDTAGVSSAAPTGSDSATPTPTTSALKPTATKRAPQQKPATAPQSSRVTAPASAPLPAVFAQARPAGIADPMNMTLPPIPGCAADRTRVVDGRGTAGFQLKGPPLFGRLVADAPTLSLTMAKCSDNAWQLVVLDGNNQYASRTGVSAASAVERQFGRHGDTEVQLVTDSNGVPSVWGVKGDQGFRIRLVPDGSQRVGYAVQNQQRSVAESHIGGP